MTGTENRPTVRARLPLRVRAMVALSRKGLPPPQHAVTVDRDLEIPAPGGITLRSDHYIPQGRGPFPALLVRSPYGRGFPWNYLFGALFAEQGFHVLLQSCRGTGGSGGTYDPFRQERADGQAAVAWLRQQDWFSGQLATIGASYLGYVQFALAADPPPELRAMIVQNGVLDPYGVMYPGGAFALENVLVATYATLCFPRGIGALVKGALRLQRRLRHVATALPLLDSYPPALGGRVGFFEHWLTHPDAGDPYWKEISLAGTPVSPAVPVSLLTGWHDICLDQTLASYRSLRDGGSAVHLVVGPWTHASAFDKDLPAVLTEALCWLRTSLRDDPASAPGSSVRVHVGGCGEWRDLPDWPPALMTPQPWYLSADGSLAGTPPAAAGISSFRYDPARPTPSAGGQLLSRKAGPVDNKALEARPDVLVFTSAPLPAALEVAGPVSVRLQVSASSPHFDIFARLCDVDAQGRSRNVCDGLVRLAPDADGSRAESLITVAMSSAAHQFAAGHRLRLQISGGAHPRFARNTGTGEPPATATRLVPVDVRVLHDARQPGALTLPVVVSTARPGSGGGEDADSAAGREAAGGRA
ncbi:MAG: CocE/NonD family hydrolase [Streptosporangiaceae bacterium]